MRSSQAAETGLRLGLYGREGVCVGGGEATRERGRLLLAGGGVTTPSLTTSAGFGAERDRPRRVGVGADA